MGTNIGTSLEGAYNAVPPPGAEMAGFGFKSLKRGLRKVGRGAVKLHTAPLKASYRVTKKAHRMTTKVVKKLPGGKLALKVAMAPLKAGKYALMAMAKLAAKPLVSIFNKLANRRANYVAYKRTGVAKASAADKRAGKIYALAKFKKAGPIGTLAVKILRAVGQAKVSGVGIDYKSWRQDAASCGMTGAEIAAAVTAILGALTMLIKSLNKKGEAPANPAAEGPPPSQNVVESQAEAPQEAPAEEPTEAPAEAPADETEGMLGKAAKAMTLEEQIAYVQDTQPNNHALLKKLAAKWRRLHPESDSMGDDREAIAGRVRKKLRRRRALRGLRNLMRRRGMAPPAPPPPRRRRHTF